MSSYTRYFPFLVLLTLSLIAAGCKKDSTTGPPAPVTGDLYPIVQGHILIYTESDVDAQNNPRSGTSHRVATMVGPTVTVEGRTGNVLIDSIYNTDGSFSDIDTLNIISLGSDGSIYLTLNTAMFSSLPISIPAVWFPIFQPSAGVGVTYNIYTVDTTIAYASGINLNLNFTIRGVLNALENVQVPLGTYSAYRGDATYEAKVTTNGIPFSDQNGTAAQMWLVDGIGPVKILYPAMSGSSTPGTVQVLIGKNY